MKKRQKEINIGERVKEVFDKSNMSVSQFAKCLLCKPQNVYNIFRRKRIDIELLCKISNALNHNFVEEVRQKHEDSTDACKKITLIFEINNADDNAIKTLLKAIKQLNIKTMYEDKD